MSAPNQPNNPTLDAAQAEADSADGTQPLADVPTVTNGKNVTTMTDKEFEASVKPA